MSPIWSFTFWSPSQNAGVLLLGPLKLECCSVARLGLSESEFLLLCYSLLMINKILSLWGEMNRWGNQLIWLTRCVHILSQQILTKVGRIMFRCYLFKNIAQSHTIYAAKGVDWLRKVYCCMHYLSAFSFTTGLI